MDRDNFDGHWLQYFPGNFMWSQGMMLAIEMAPWKGASLGEAHLVARRLIDHESDNEAWFDEWTRMANHVQDSAVSNARAGHDITAGEMFFRAAVYYFVAERVLPPSDPRKNRTYRRVKECFIEYASRLEPSLEAVGIPYENGSELSGYYLPAHDVGAAGRCMVFFDGLDIAKELMIGMVGKELRRRGVGCLVVDGPGQGESLRIGGIPSRHDYEVPATAAYEYLSSRSDVDLNRVGIMAISMGGYYAPRAAAFEHRYKLCVAWGGHFDYHEVWTQRRKVMEKGGTKVSAPGFQLPWVLGVSDMDAAMKKLEDYSLSDVADQIECPLLVLHGENDTLVPVEMARRLYDAAGSQDKELKIFTSEDGGSEHCLEDNRQLIVAYLSDWISDRL